MELNTVIDLISNFGFPIALVIVLGVFIFKIYTDSKKEKAETAKTNAENMEKVQARCKEREEKLYEEIKANREINAKAVATIERYAERLDAIQEDIKEIKKDVIILTAK